MFFFRLCFVFCFFFSKSYGYLRLPLQQQKHIVSLSKKDMNKISFENDRIKRVIGLDSSCSMEFDEDLGQIFIKSMQENESSSTLTLMTESGAMQDIEISFLDKSGEHLVIYSEGELDSSQDKSSNKTGGLIDFVKKVFNGKVEKHKLKKGVFDRKQGDLKLVAKFSMKSLRYKALVFEIFTNNKNGSNISEKEISKENDQAIFLESNHVAYKTSITCIIFQANGGGVV